MSTHHSSGRPLSLKVLALVSWEGSSLARNMEEHLTSLQELTLEMCDNILLLPILPESLRTQIFGRILFAWGHGMPWGTRSPQLRQYPFTAKFASVLQETWNLQLQQHTRRVLSNRTASKLPQVCSYQREMHFCLPCYGAICM